MKKQFKYHDIRQPTFYGRNIEETENRHKTFSNDPAEKKNILILNVKTNPDSYSKL